MSLGDKLRKEGEIIGKVKGKLESSLEIAQKMLDDGVEPVFVAKYTGVSLQQVKEIKSRH